MIQEHAHAHAYLSLDLAEATARYHILQDRVEDVVNVSTKAIDWMAAGQITAEQAVAMMKEPCLLLAAVWEELKNRA